MGSFIGAMVFLATSTISFVVPTAHASFTPSPSTTVQELAANVALQHGISLSTLSNLVSSESGWKVILPVTDHGCTYGLVQINTCAHPDVTQAEAEDPIFALNYAATAIEKGEEDEWTSCNCYSLVSTKIRDLPHMADIQPNSYAPHVGDVAIFYYKDIETGRMIKHIAYITSVGDGTFKVLESNKVHCLVDTRTIDGKDIYLAGFWSPNMQ